MTAQPAVAQEATHLDGLDVQAAVDTVAAPKAAESLAGFQLRARNIWIDGGENCSTIRDFYGTGQQDTSRLRAFEFTNGEPPVLLANNEGANPVEFRLRALAQCVTTTFVLHAMARDITIKELSTELNRNIDLQGLLGLDDGVPAGYEQVDIKMKVKADYSDKELDDPLTYIQQHSAVCRPVPVVSQRGSGRDQLMSAAGFESGQAASHLLDPVRNRDSKSPTEGPK